MSTELIVHFLDDPTEEAGLEYFLTTIAKLRAAGIQRIRVDGFELELAPKLHGLYTGDMQIPLTPG